MFPDRHKKQVRLYTNPQEIPSGHPLSPMESRSMFYTAKELQIQHQRDVDQCERCLSPKKHQHTLMLPIYWQQQQQQQRRRQPPTAEDPATPPWTIAAATTIPAVGEDFNNNTPKDALHASRP